MGANKSNDLEPIISDGNYDFFNKTPEDYKGIVLDCIHKIININNSSLSNSGKIYLKIQGQMIEKEENTLKIFYQLVDTLEDLLTFYFDEEIVPKLKEINDLLDNIYKKYLDIYVSREQKYTTQQQAKNYQIIPKDNPLGRWCHDQIEVETKKLYRNKFTELLLLFKRKNDLSGKRYAAY